MTNTARAYHVEDHGNNVSVITIDMEKVRDEKTLLEIKTGLTGMIDAFDARTKPLVIVDMSSVKEMTAAAIGGLLEAKKLLKSRNGKLEIVGLNPKVVEIFTATRVDLALSTHTAESGVTTESLMASHAAQAAARTPA